jgi:ATP-dependent DNA helicase PIF1
LPAEFLNKQNPADMPPHELTLKVNSIAMITRNIATREGLCNGTRVLITKMQRNFIKAKILTGIFLLFILFNYF